MDKFNAIQYVIANSNIRRSVWEDTVVLNVVSRITQSTKTEFSVDDLQDMFRFEAAGRGVFHPHPKGWESVGGPDTLTQIH